MINTSISDSGDEYNDKKGRSGPYGFSDFFICVYRAAFCILYCLRASGFLDFLAKLLEGPAAVLQIPVPLISVILVRIVSGSAAVGLILDIFKEYGPDSLEGTMASIMMGCTETVFYTMSVYFMAAHIRKTRWTLPGALLATAGGIAASIILAEMMVK